MKASSFCGMAFLFWACSSVAEVVIPANTVVPVRATQAIEGRDIRPGQEIILVVAANIKIDGEYVIKAGAPVVAFVNDASNAQMAGIAGKISLSMRSTIAVDGSTVPLSGEMLNAGESEVGSTVAVGAVLCPLALLNKGKSGRITPGMEIRAMTIGDVDVDPANPISIEYLSTESEADQPKDSEAGDAKDEHGDEW